MKVPKQDKRSLESKGKTGGVFMEISGAVTFVGVVRHGKTLSKIIIYMNDITEKNRKKRPGANHKGKRPDVKKIGSLPKDGEGRKKSHRTPIP